MNESILDAVTPIMRRCGFCCQSNKYFDGFVDFPRTARIQVQLCAIAFKSQNKREKLHKIVVVIKSTNLLDFVLENINELYYHDFELNPRGKNRARLISKLRQSIFCRKCQNDSSLNFNFETPRIAYM